MARGIEQKPAAMAAPLMAAFTAAIFVSAALLFSIQPMFTKMALPLLGGAPNVWNTAMVFFQGMLLLGYLYAHGLARWLRPAASMAVHGVVLLAAFIFLPFAIGDNVRPDPDAPILWLIGLLTVSIGLPFFALSANAPLLQHWFAGSDHRDAEDPYFLYGASNLGSLLALLSYPVLIEPALGLSGQSFGWAFGYGLLIVLIGGAAILALRAPRSTVVTQDQAKPAITAEITAATRLFWIAAAAIPSALMLAVTSQITANVTAAPLLWIGPLSLYLLTFVIVFAKKPVIRLGVVALILPAALFGGIAIAAVSTGSFALEVGFYLFIFFIITLYCHARLAGARPPAARLTEFYFFMSLGGVLGGAFTAIAAPVLFNDVYEYPMAIVAAGALALTAPEAKRRPLVALGAAIFAGVILAAMLAAARPGLAIAPAHASLALFAVAAAIIVTLRKRADIMIGALVVFAAAVQISSGPKPGEGREIFKTRNFFGVTTVLANDEEVGRVHRFLHGDTWHNLQIRSDAHRRTPLLYFTEDGPFGQIVRASRLRRDAPLRVGVIGLGAGATACLAQPDERWTFYEIDPAVIAMALDDDLFTFVRNCQGDSVEIVKGDARLAIEDAPDAAFDVIFIDAFSSDSIPAHLITTNAVELYRRKLAPDGLIFFHTSNRMLDVTSVAVGAAEKAGLATRAIHYRPAIDDELAPYRTLTYAAVAGPEDILLAAPLAALGWRRYEPHPAVDIWTDDYSHIFGAIRARADGGGTFEDAPQ